MRKESGRAHEGRRKRRQKRSWSEGGGKKEKRKGFSRRKCSKKGTRYGSYPRLWPRESVRRRGLHGSHIHLSRYSLSIRGTRRNETKRVDSSRVESMSPPAESVRYDTLKPLETSCRTCTWNETTSAKRDRSIRPARNCPPFLSVENLSRNNGPSLFVDHHRRPITRRDGSRLLLFICFIYIYILYTVPTLWSLNWPSVDDHYLRSFPPSRRSLFIPPSRISYVLHLPRFSPLPQPPFLLERVSTLTTTILKESSPEKITGHHLREPAIFLSFFFF